MDLKWMNIIFVFVLALTLTPEALGKKKEMPMESTTKAMIEEETAEGMMEEMNNTTISSDDESDPAVALVSSKKSVKNFTCKVTGALLSMANSIKELGNEIKEIKEQMLENCPGFQSNATIAEDVGDAMTNESLSDSKTELEGQPEEEDGTTTTPLPLIPTECDEPFSLIASSCYYFLYYAADWKTWGDANAYCQKLGGTLAAPYRKEELRDHLKDHYSNVFWVGARQSPTGGKTSFEWLNGEEMSPDDWKEGQPSSIAAKGCVYLESTSGYKAMNFYCGEKFSFICEKRA